MTKSSPAASESEIIDFWLALAPEKHFSVDAALDGEIKARFGALHKKARAGALDAWEENPRGALGLVLLLDQFSRNMFRGEAAAFASDAQALGVARRAIARRFDVETPVLARVWFYMPFMHAEDMEMQKLSVAYCAERLDSPGTLRHARVHSEVIRRFGRFPARNLALGRETTPSEESYLTASTGGAV